MPYPFARTVVRWGEPIRVTKNSNLDNVRAKLEAALTELQTRADRACGRERTAGANPGKLVATN